MKWLKLLGSGFPRSNIIYHLPKSHVRTSSTSTCTKRDLRILTPCSCKTKEHQQQYKKTNHTSANTHTKRKKSKCERQREYVGYKREKSKDSKERTEARRQCDASKPFTQNYCNTQRLGCLCIVFECKWGKSIQGGINSVPDFGTQDILNTLLVDAVCQKYASRVALRVTWEWIWFMGQNIRLNFQVGFWSEFYASAYLSPVFFLYFRYWARQRCHTFSIMGCCFFYSTIYALLHQDSIKLTTVATIPNAVKLMWRFAWWRNSWWHSQVTHVAVERLATCILIWSWKICVVAPHNRAYTSKETCKCHCKWTDSAGTDKKRRYRRSDDIVEVVQPWHVCLVKPNMNTRKR